MVFRNPAANAVKTAVISIHDLMDRQSWLPSSTIASIRLCQLPGYTNRRMYFSTGWALSGLVGVLDLPFRRTPPILLARK
jgi:hypothetical protein